MMRKKLVICLVIAVIFATVTPMSITTVLAATEDHVTVTFNPTGNISIEISPPTYDFGAIYAEGWVNTSGTTFTIYNNGSVGMDTEIKTNGTTESTNFTLDTTGATIELIDNFALQTNGLDSDAWLTSGYSNVDTDIAADASTSFDLRLHIGNISENFGQEQVRIYVQGSQT